MKIINVITAGDDCCIRFWTLDISFNYFYYIYAQIYHLNIKMGF